MTTCDRCRASGVEVAEALGVDLCQRCQDAFAAWSEPSVERAPVTIEAIQRATCDHFGVAYNELVSPDTARHLSFPRQVAIYVCRQRLASGLKYVGKAFGRHHTSILSAQRKVRALLAARDVRAIHAVESILRAVG
jgi:chromosomal replication initiation ATPase DnaA